MNKTETNNLSTVTQLQLDRGLHYGDGLFETIAVKSGTAELLEEHIARLRNSCQRLKIVDVDFSSIKKEIESISKSIDKGIVKLIVTRGSGGRGYAISDEMHANFILLQYPWPDYDVKNREAGVTIKKCELILGYQPILAGMKHLNRLENVMARLEINYDEFQEGLLCDSEQNVIEATSSNLFIVTKNKIITPKLNRCGVSGVMRDLVINKAMENNIKIDTQDIPFKLLLDADELFLTNSVIGIWPVARLNERIYSNFSTTRKLMDILNIRYNEQI